MHVLRIAALCAALLLAGCSSTPADLEAKTTPIIQTYPDNYQEIYRRISTTAKRCVSAITGSHSAYAVDADLYSELGYGEITASLISYGARNYYWSARVERAGTGAKLTVRSANSLASERTAQTILNWANGDQNCPML
jgi:hypothetical protein